MPPTRDTILRELTKLQASGLYVTPNIPSYIDEQFLEKFGYNGPISSVLAFGKSERTGGGVVFSPFRLCYKFGSGQSGCFEYDDIEDTSDGKTLVVTLSSGSVHELHQIEGVPVSTLKVILDSWMQINTIHDHQGESWIDWSKVGGFFKKVVKDLTDKSVKMQEDHAKYVLMLRNLDNQALHDFYTNKHYRRYGPAMIHALKTVFQERGFRVDNNG